MERRWLGPLSPNTSLAFLADRVSRILGDARRVEPGDFQVLEGASHLLETALEGQTLLREDRYEAGAAPQFKAFSWAARVLASGELRRVSEPSDVQDALESMREVLIAVMEGRDANPELKEHTSTFFVELRDLALSRASKPGDSFSYISGAPLQSATP